MRLWKQIWNEWEILLSEWNTEETWTGKFLLVYSSLMPPPYMVLTQWEVRFCVLRWLKCSEEMISNFCYFHMTISRRFHWASKKNSVIYNLEKTMKSKFYQLLLCYWYEMDLGSKVAPAHLKWRTIQSRGLESPQSARKWRRGNGIVENAVQRQSYESIDLAFTEKKKG